MIIPFQIDSIKGQDGYLSEVIVRDLNEKKVFLKADYFLPFYGLSSDLGPIKNWEIEINNNNLEINQATCETSRKGILTGFSEAAIAAQSCYKKIFPNKTLHFEYSTTKGINKI